MTEPVWIDCITAADVGSVKRLAEQASARRCIVLRFSSLSTDEKEALISRLSSEFPDFSVFDSGIGHNSESITIMPVVARARVLERRADVVRAIEKYRRTCAELVRQYELGMLPADWLADEHGEHCRFKCRRTGQVVEAPFEWIDAIPVDPYFFAEFVKSTAGLERVAALIDDEFHDGARILEVVGTFHMP